MKKKRIPFSALTTEAVKREESRSVVLKVSAKCSDMFSASLIGVGRKTREYSGYVPVWFPNSGVRHFGDYIELDIDIITGKILNWVEPSQDQVDEAFK